MVRSGLTLAIVAAALAAACGALIGEQATSDPIDGGPSIDGAAAGDAAEAAPPPPPAVDAGADATPFCMRRTGDRMCEDFDEGHPLPLNPLGTGDGGVVADPSATSPPNVFESTSLQMFDHAIAGYYVGPFDDNKTYAFDFDYRIVTPASVGGPGAVFAYVEFRVGAARTYALELAVDTSPAARIVWHTFSPDSYGASVSADISGTGPWYHLSFTLDASGAKTSHGTASAPAALGGDVSLVLGLVQTPNGGEMTVRYDSATVH